MKIAVIGLGKMGLPIARNLLQSGHQVIGYNRSEARRNLFHGDGGVTHETIHDAVKDAEVVITMLSNDDAVIAVSQQMSTSLKAGVVHISMSTISAKTAEMLTHFFRERNISFLSAPVLGRPPAAEARQLFILLSGDALAKERVKDIWGSISQNVFDFGEKASTAKSVKLMMNYMIFVITGMLSEMMIMAEKSDIDKRNFLDTMLATVFGAPVFRNYGTLLIDEKNNPNGFATALASKDLRLMQENAAAHDMRLPLGEIVQQHFQEIIASGGGNQDVALLVSHLRNKLGQPGRIFL